MHQRVRPVFLTPFLVLGLILGAYAQNKSLTSILSEEEPFYLNYGSDPYAREAIKSEQKSYYDLFGSHITDGFFVYQLENQKQAYSKTGELEFDSTALRRSNEQWDQSFYNNFTNLVMTRDAIGGTKTTFLVGDQIKTRFTPFTLNKQNYKGIRWDLWTTGMKFTALLSRTYPGAIAFSNVSGASPVDYPLVDGSFVNRFWSSGVPDSLETDGSVELAKFRSADYSNKSPYGDYNLYWSFHAENNLANMLQYGVTFINHHRTDIAKGEAFSGNLPDGWVPNEIHFEFYDLTPGRTSDAGCYVHDIQMKINGNPAGGPSGVYGVDVGDTTLYGTRLPRIQNGWEPTITTFNPARPKAPISIPKDQIKHVSFEYSVAGNYLVFVSTDRFIPLGIGATIARSAAGEGGQDIVLYGDPATKKVDEIFATGSKISSNQAPIDGATYFGDYIAKSPKMIAMDSAVFLSGVELFKASGFTASAPANFRTYNYEFTMNVNNITYGANFKGQLYGVNFEGEFATSVREALYPGADNKLKDYESQKLRSNVLQFKADRDILRKVNISGEFYNIDPNYEANLKALQPSLYMSKTTYASPTQTDKKLMSRDYLVHPQPLSNGFQALDDNEDGDLYVENNRRPYPSDRSESGSFDFTNDGLFRNPYIGQTDGVRLLQLPNGMYMIYDDQDGVISNRYDRNKNGVVDYKEDFLLYSTDKPEFELGNDLNFNGVYDYEDDDILPELPYFLPNIITSNGYRSYGLRGLAGKIRFLPTAGLEINAGARLENALNTDLTPTGTSQGDESEGKSTVLYGTGMLKITKRSQGIEYYIGNEVYLVKDAIRNDVVTTVDKGVYEYNVDPLRYRDALLTKLVSGITYLNIPNFEINSGVMAGLEVHNPSSELYYTTRARTYLTDLGRDSLAYESFWEPYYARTIAKAYLMLKFGYSKKWNLEYEGWRSALNIFNRLTVIPQYKVAYDFRRNIKKTGDTGELDPRDDSNFFYPDLLTPAQATEYKNRWGEYDNNTEDNLLSVPLLRINFQIAEKTALEAGMQWMRSYDRITQTNSFSKMSKVAQIVSRDSYAGYNVSIMFGINIADYDYDTNLRDRFLYTGSDYNEHHSEVFARVYAGL